MPQAPAYTRQTGFADDERNNAGGRTTVRADRLDAELDAAGAGINGLRANLAKLQRDDGQLRDGLIPPAALSPTTVAMLGGSKFVPRGAHASGAVYAANDLVEIAGVNYVCVLPHTAVAFAADRAAGRWQVFPGLPLAASTVFDPTAAVPQANVQAAVEHVAADARRLGLAGLAFNFGGL